MRKKMFKLAWALLLLAGGLTALLTPQNVNALTCHQALQNCSAACDPSDEICYQECQCVYRRCLGLQCN